MLKRLGTVALEEGIGWVWEITSEVNFTTPLTTEGKEEMMSVSYDLSIGLQVGFHSVLPFSL